MANVSVYLDDVLRERVRRADLPISRICQQALRAELAARDPDGVADLIADQLDILSELTGR